MGPTLAEQSKVDQASKQYAKYKWSFEYDDLHKRLRVSTSETDFKAGVDFALDHLFAGRMERLLQTFGDWLWRNYKQIDAQVWKERWSTSDTVYTLYQVIAKYLHHLETIKQKEDVRP